MKQEGQAWVIASGHFSVDVSISPVKISLIYSNVSIHSKPWITEDEMVEKAISPTLKQCVACKEDILADALICPKCRSRQKPQKRENLLITLKWIGGITALISLIIGIKQVSIIVKEWKETCPSGKVA